MGLLACYGLPVITALVPAHDPRFTLRFFSSLSEYFHWPYPVQTRGCPVLIGLTLIQLVTFMGDGHPLSSLFYVQLFIVILHHPQDR